MSALAAILVGACGGGDGHVRAEQVTATAAAHVARWTPAMHVAAVLDVAGPRSDGSLVVAAADRLSLLDRAGALKPFARAAGGYASPGGGEPYVTPSGPPCARDTVYALRLARGPGVTAVDRSGRARRLARLPGGALPSGLAFDGTGRFGHRLLVIATGSSRSTVYAIDCRGAVATITRSAPRVEGGYAVAPSTFGHFAGDLIAPDERSGRVYAIDPDGRSRLVATSGLPHGGDIGVESAGFVPARYRDALVADRVSPGNPHPGDDAVLRVSHADLARAGVRAGDALVASEGGALTVAIRCGARSCRVMHVADGPGTAHLEGHIAFSSR